MWKQRRNIVACLVLCIGVFGWFSIAAEIRAEAVSGQEEMEQADSAWMDKEVVVELDENNMDENGCTYEFSSDTEKKAKLKKIQISRYQDRETDIEIRVPDKVVKGGEEYVVTDICISADNPNASMRAEFCFYAGKEVCKIDWQSMPCASVCYPHRESKYFTVEKGSLFNHDKTELIHFNDKYYGADKVYEIPETVSKIRGKAFEYANIKEVVLNDKIDSILADTFECSTLQKIDLKNVKEIHGYAFFFCKMLKEVRIRQEGISIQQRAFDGSGLESLYLPPDACVDCCCDFSGCEDLKTVIIGGQLRIEGSSYYMGLFDGCISLQTAILPDNMPNIMEAMFGSCVSLRKLYVPDSVESIGERAFDVEEGNLTLYGKAGSPAAAHEDAHVSFVDVSGHTHKLKEVMFIKYDTWGVKGKYCEECGYGTEIETVEFDGGGEEDIPVLETEEDTCPEVLSLNEKCQDCQGGLYNLDENTGTATVAKLTRSFANLFLVPEKVEKDGKTYVVDTIGGSATRGKSIKMVILSDRVKKIEEQAMSGVRNRIILGEGVEEIDDSAFSESEAVIRIRGMNPCFKIEGDGLYTADGSKLIKYAGERNAYCPEFKVPTRVRTIAAGAFYCNETIDRITIYKCGSIEVQDGAFTDCRAEITYMNDVWYEEGELVLELDENNMDENGCTYELYTDTATLKKIQISRYKDRKTDIKIRVPDKVVKGDKEYVVTGIRISADDPNARMRAGFCFYAGKEVRDISWGSVSCASECYPHGESKYFTVERGSLFNHDKTRLIHFSDKYYGADQVYEIPETVSKISGRTFAYANIKEVVLNDKIDSLPYDAFYRSALQKIDLKNNVNNLVVV